MLAKMLETLAVICRHAMGPFIIMGVVVLALLSTFVGNTLPFAFLSFNVFALYRASTRLTPAQLQQELDKFARDIGMQVEDRPIPPVVAPRPILLPPLDVPRGVPARPAAGGISGVIRALFNSTPKSVGPKTFQQRLDDIHFAGDVPDNLCCPVSLSIMNDPITLPTSGRTYDRASLIEFARTARDPLVCPLTRKPLDINHVMNTATNYEKKGEIEKFVTNEEAKHRALPVQAPAASSSSRWSLFGGRPAQDAAASQSGPAPRPNGH